MDDDDLEEIDDLGFQAQKARHEKIKADERELKLSILKGKHVSREAVGQAAATAMAVLSQTMRSLSDSLERRFALRPEVAEAVAVEVDAALTEVARAFEAMVPPNA